MSRASEAQDWLEKFVVEQGGCAGSVHYWNGAALELAAAVNLPEVVKKVTAIVPRGKGMAGLAYERNEAVTSCNIQTDTSGHVKPGARAVDARAAAALPVRDGVGAVRAVVGIAFMREGELPPAELARLDGACGSLPDR